MKSLTFKEFQTIFKQHADNVLKYDNLFLLDVDKDELWNTYLESFPPEYNQVYRERREFDCSCCRQVIKNVGALVAITPEFEIVSLWDFDTNDPCYQPMLEAMRALLQTEIESVFLSKFSKIGQRVTYEQIDNIVKEWNHLFFEIPNKYVTRDVAALQEAARAEKQVFQRGLEEISRNAITEVLDMIEEKVLYRGEEWKKTLQNFLALHEGYHSLPERKRNKYAWRMSKLAGPVLAKIKNHSIGTLLVDLTNGVDAETAIKKWENIMAPTNYRRPTALITPKMLKAAKEKIIELGFENSLGGRFANIHDIAVSNVLWINRNIPIVDNRLGVFDELADELPVDVKKLKNVRVITIENFMESLNEISSLELLFENKHAGNLVSLIAPLDETAPSPLKWENNFRWAYRGNLTDSIAERVKAAGGEIDADVCFRLAWDNNDDLDLHVIEATNPNGVYEIFYVNKRKKSWNGGILDVDANGGDGLRDNPCENIFYKDAKTMHPGVYRVFVQQYSHRTFENTGFRFEISIMGEITEYSYPHEMRTGKIVDVAKLHITNKGFELKSLLDATTTSRSTWNIASQRFHPCSVIMYSPNFWSNEQIGNLHYLFMLKDCINNERPNAFYNEFLHPDLNPHRKVFEVVGSKLKVEPSQEQLSGLGFSETKRVSVFARVNKRQIVNIIF